MTVFTTEKAEKSPNEGINPNPTARCFELLAPFRPPSSAVQNATSPSGPPDWLSEPLSCDCESSRCAGGQFACGH
eukprot:7498596-Pyramimonas_sp.AAC.1